MPDKDEAYSTLISPAPLFPFVKPPVVVPFYAAAETRLVPKVKVLPAIRTEPPAPPAP